uniref:Uncharacterized protein n=1 Tax=Loa loa TaxID=7209 RepID=A0A1I7VJU9_LOALO
MLANPGNPDIANPLDFLKRESVMLQTFQGFVSGTVEFETSLITCLEEAEKRLVEYAGRNTHDEMDEGLAHQEPEFNEETEWAALPEEDDETENWPSGSEWTPLSDDEEDEPEVTVIRMETSGVEEPEETIREIVLRPRTIRFLVPATHTALAAAIPEVFHPEDLGDLPEQFQGELEVAQAEPLLLSMRPLPPAATRIHGRTENSSGGTPCPRLVSEGICGRDQRKTGKASANNAIWHSTSGQPATACSSSPSPIQRRHKAG